MQSFRLITTCHERMLRMSSRICFNRVIFSLINCVFYCGSYLGFILYVTDKSFQYSASSPTKAEWRLLLSAWLPELKELMWSLDSAQDMSTVSSQDQGVWRWWCLSVFLCLSFSLWPFSLLTSICQLSNYLNFSSRKR